MYNEPMYTPTLQPLLEQSDAHHRNAGVVRRFGMLLGKGEVDRREREAQQVLECMAQAGYLGVVPRHKENNDIRGTHLQVTIGVAATIQSRVGRAHRMLMEDAVLGRWSVLLHEAAHQEMLLMAKPGPLPGVNEPVARILADWSLGGWGGGGGNHLMGMLGENFADAYSHMLMCRGLKSSERLACNLDQLMQERRQDERKADALLKDMLARDEMEFLNEPTSIHRTHRTLELVNRQQKQWSQMDPEQLRGKAMELAQQGLMDTLDPNRLDDTGFPIGLTLRRWAIPARPEATLQALMQVLGYSYVEGANLALLGQSIANLPNKYQPLLAKALPLMARTLDERGARTIRMGQVQVPQDWERQFMTNTLWSDLATGREGRALENMQTELKQEYAHDRRVFIEQFMSKPMRDQPAVGAYLGLRMFLEKPEQFPLPVPGRAIPLKPQ